MSSYVAKAYVSKHNWETQEVAKELRAIGYTFDGERDGYAHRLFIANGEYRLHLGFFHIPDSELIDCNAYTQSEEEAVRLLLELAQMRDDIDNRQWFYGTNIYGELVYQKCEGFMWIVFRSKFVLDEDIKRLSPLGLAQAVKDGKIKL